MEASAVPPSTVNFMKIKPIIADPHTLDNAGIRTMRQASVFLHIGRCGLVGATIPGISEALKINGNGLDHVIHLLVDLGLITDYTRKTGQGRARLYVVTVKGWGVLTHAPDLSMFVNAGGMI